ncbi:porin family protein [Hyunsoonleella rubra]|uniref:Porin family protein n=1 Tax=Hyunsoonleella rubra TaxID=1737062 RepID=A0ABW5TCC4_9FLAO
MKKLLIVVILLISSINAFAQIELSPGIRGGVNFANITNTAYDAKTDFYIGAFGEIKFANFYALQPEVTYSRQGAKSRLSSGSDIEIQYLAITIANKFSPFRDLGLHAIIGPTFNFKLADNAVAEAYEGFDIGFMGGLGYELPFGLAIEARYIIGFVDILGSNINNTVAFDELYVNKVFQVGVAYKFNFKR